MGNALGNECRCKNQCFKDEVTYLNLAFMKEVMEGHRMKVNKAPEMFATIQELVLHDGGELRFTPLNFSLQELEVHVVVEFKGSQAQFAAEFGLNVADKIVAKALNNHFMDQAKHHAEQFGSLGKKAANATSSGASAVGSTALHTATNIEERVGASKVGSVAKGVGSTAMHTATHVRDKVGGSKVGSAAKEVGSTAMHKVGALEEKVKEEGSHITGKVKDTPIGHHGSAPSKEGDLGDIGEQNAQKINFTMELVLDMVKEMNKEHVVVKIHDLKTSLKFLEKILKNHGLRDKIESHISKKATEVINKKLEKLHHHSNTVSFVHEHDQVVDDQVHEQVADTPLKRDSSRGHV